MSDNSFVILLLGTVLLILAIALTACWSYNAGVNAVIKGVPSGTYRVVTNVTYTLEDVPK